jgi:hypothetical protein
VSASKYLKDVRLEEAAPYRSLPRFAETPSSNTHRVEHGTHRRTLLGLPARTPVFSQGDKIAIGSSNRQDAA